MNTQIIENFKAKCDYPRTSCQFCKQREKCDLIGHILDTKELYCETEQYYVGAIPKMWEQPEIELLSLQEDIKEIINR